MHPRVKVAECDIPPQAGCSLEEATDQGAIRRYVWRSGRVTLPSEIEVECVPYVGPNDSTGYLLSIFEAPSKIEGMS